MTNTFKSGLVQLGQWFRGELPGRGGDDADLLSTAEGQNRWFTPDFVRMALHANGTMLDPLTLDRWTDEYPELSMERKPQRIGLVLAGNLPMVGWHDI
ncbi:MAG TPA: acyl-CoA reductase, partial [Flavobacteriales bacterium]|nr:acyl-CoA reductase [Flavobacteriales bacterium]